MLDQPCPDKSEGWLLKCRQGCLMEGAGRTRSKPEFSKMPRALSGFTVFQPVPGSNFPRPLFVIRARSKAQAERHARALVPGEVLVFGPVNPRGPLARDIARDPNAIIAA
jgi:hypothetical protein